MTRHALGDVEKYSRMKVKPENFAAVLPALGYTSELELLEDLRIHKSFRFAFKAGEKIGTPISALEILSVYSDEADWQMDMHLFDSDQYPEIWNDAFKFMGGRVGIPSQAFRHMYWSAFDWFNPLPTFRLPLSRLFQPMGAAPERAAVFVGLARKAAQAGHSYWALRFLADGLHYLQDVSSPFHATQTPTKLFITMPFTEPAGRGIRSYVKQVTHVVSYYHFSFEIYIGKVLTMPGLAPEAREAFTKALAGHETTAYEGGAGGLIVKIQRESMERSSEAARASLAFFPPLTEPYDTVEPVKFMNEKWFADTVARGERPSVEKTRYFKTVTEMFSHLGRAVRGYCQSEIEALQLK